MSTVEKATCRPAIFPYFAEREQWPPDTLNGVYRKLKEQDVLADLLHEGVVEEDEFVKFIHDNTLSYLFFDMTENKIAGIAWYDMVEEGECLKKGRGSFAFFREYWDPKLTEAFGMLFLSHGFGMVGLDLIYGITPASNKLAVKYAERLGFVYGATIPQFCSRRGELTDAMLCTMNSKTFGEKLKAMEWQEVPSGEISE